MNTVSRSSDAAMVYRETSSANVIRLEGTADAGSLLDFLRNSTVQIGRPSIKSPPEDERTLLTPMGSIDAIA